MDLNIAKQAFSDELTKIAEAKETAKKMVGGTLGALVGASIGGYVAANVGALLGGGAGTAGRHLGAGLGALGGALVGGTGGGVLGVKAMGQKKEAAEFGKVAPYFAGHSLLNPLLGSGYGALAGGLTTERGQKDPAPRGAAIGALTGGAIYGASALSRGLPLDYAALLAASGAIGGGVGGAHTAYRMAQGKKKKEAAEERKLGFAGNFDKKHMLKAMLEEGGPALGATLGAGIAAGYGKPALTGAALGYGAGSIPELLRGHGKKPA